MYIYIYFNKEDVRMTIISNILRQRFTRLKQLMVYLIYSYISKK